MCGIFGIVSQKNAIDSKEHLLEMTNDLFLLSESRGKEASGIATRNGSVINIYKEPIGASDLIQKEPYKKLVEDLYENNDSFFALIGHARLATNGLQTDNLNNQPVVTDNTLGVHNGIVVNDSLLWKITKKKPRFEVDTEVVFELINKYLAQYSLAGSVQKMYGDIEGSASLAMFFKNADELVLSTNTGSLYFFTLPSYPLFVFASEEYILLKWKEKHITDTDSNSVPIHHIHAGTGVIIDIKSTKYTSFTISGRPEKRKRNNSKISLGVKDHTDENAHAEETVISLYKHLNDLKKIQKHNFDYKAIYALKRCSRCILPETTPFISFDANGVCNFCHEHRKIPYKGKDALLKLIEPLRSRDGRPDCIVAFSGGRDSSYGLHVLKKELGMNPIAYTYDWGMVTDVARRNEARMVGKLGIEHVIVSADITMKRDHIRKHILAWMKKPDLGMVPLFMEGDKQCEFYADRLAKNNNIDLVIFCRGNELEKDEFKTGHCGIKNADPNGVIHNLAVSGKIKIAMYYAWQYITNPAYINSSIFDTLFAYFSTYIQKHDYIFLWHYIPWDEGKIVSTLKNTYNWETSPETTQTWRTDDGTSAFYNYIYYAGQGFTENDSFRGRQVREGKLTRKKALELVNEENKPRHNALKWYFDRIGLDGDEVLSVVDRMPKLYAHSSGYLR